MTKPVPYNPNRAAALGIDEGRWHWLALDAAANHMTPEAYALRRGLTMSPSYAAERSHRGGDSDALERQANWQSSLDFMGGGSIHTGRAWRVQPGGPDLDTDA